MQPTEATTLVVEVKEGILLFHQRLSVQSCCARLDIRPSQEVYALGLIEPVGCSLRFVIDGSREWTVSRGEYLVVNPNSTGWVNPRQPRWPVRFHQFIATQALLRLVREAAGLPRAWGPFAFAQGPHPLTPSLASALRGVEEAAREPVSALGHAAASRAACVLWLLHLLRHHPNRLRQQWEDHGTPRALDPRLQAAIDHLEERYASPHSVAALARTVGASERSLRRSFREGVRQSPNDFLQAVRVRKAIELLTDPQRTVEAVAAAVGYGNASALRKAFLAHARAIPSAFRPRTAGP